MVNIRINLALASLAIFTSALIPVVTADAQSNNSLDLVCTKECSPVPKHCPKGLFLNHAGDCFFCCAEPPSACLLVCFPDPVDCPEGMHLEGSEGCYTCCTGWGKETDSAVDASPSA
ncbi:hypothetical protein CPC08DRAFT_711525 [Agrocybe pediades]|nr:hypothetical protein CPC08DRAFT_711525 [Agrocybe pediades]